VYNLSIYSKIEAFLPLKAFPNDIISEIAGLHQRSPPVVVGGALRAGIGMTINLPGHPMSVTQHYLN